MMKKSLGFLAGSAFLMVSLAFAGGGSGSHGGWGVIVKLVGQPSEKIYFLDDFAAYEFIGDVYLASTDYATVNDAHNGFTKRAELFGLNSDEAARLEKQLRVMSVKIDQAPEMTKAIRKNLRSDYIPFTIDGRFIHRYSSDYRLSPIIAFWDHGDGRVQKNSALLKQVRPYGVVAASFHEWFSTRGRKKKIQSEHQTIEARDAWVELHNPFMVINRNKRIEAIRARLAE